MVRDLVKALRQRELPPVEPLDVEAIRSRIGDPLPPRKPAEAGYTRSDERPLERRSWRKVAGLSR